MRIAIYSRKSKFVAESNSVENQITLCKQHINRHYNNENQIYIYEDEGFSGGNTDRPQFKKLIRDINDKKIDVLVCYKLDRISRNVSDFSSTYEILEKNNVTFISISENFDTGTPLGKAMLYIASVFAQLERETIAERVRDNMYELARKGVWLGGRLVLGYNNVKEVCPDSNGKEKTVSYLVVDDKEIEIVKEIFSKYLEIGSLSKLYKHFLVADIRGKQGGQMGKTELNDILRQPIYVQANDDVFTYLKSKGYSVFGVPNGKNGLISYSKKKAKIVAVAKHDGSISSESWLRVQLLLDKNKAKAPRIGTSHTALLTNVLRCSCGGTMRVSYSRNTFYYVCSIKAQTNGELCQSKNLNGANTEKTVIDFLKSFNTTVFESEYGKHLRKLQKEILKNENKIKNIEKEIKIKTNNLNKLIKRMSLVDDDAVNDIVAVINSERKIINNLNINLNELIDINTNLKNESLDKDLTVTYIDNFTDVIDREDVTIEKKRAALNKVVSRVSWDYKNEKLEINIFS